MKLRTSLVSLLIFATALACGAQSRTNRLQRPCPNTSTPAVVEIQKDGDINLHPCPSRSFLINDLSPASSVSFGGSSRTSYFPYYSAENTLSLSPFSWDGASYDFDLPTGDAAFKMSLKPSVLGAGSFSVGSAAGARFTLDEPTKSLYLEGGGIVFMGFGAYSNSYTIGDETSAAHIRGDSLNGNIIIGDAAWSHNGTNIAIDDAAQSIMLNGMGESKATIFNGLAAGAAFDVAAKTVSIGKLDTNDNLLFMDGNAGSAQLGGLSTTVLGNNANALKITASTDTLSTTLSTWDLSSPSAGYGVSKFKLLRYIAAAGDVANPQTINLPAGSVNVAAGASSVQVNNNTVDASSLVFTTVRSNDATCTVKNVVPISGSFVIRMTANCTAETSVGFLVTN